MSDEFDVIVAGGGSAGCVVAGRLAAADPNLRVLIVEAGPDTKNDLSHVQPSIHARHLAPDSKTVKYIASKPSEVLNGRTVFVPAPSCVGGGSSVNFLAYTRGSPSDYDDWEAKYNNPGWGFKDLLPYFKKCETYQVEPDQDTHGYSGPLKVSQGGIYGNVGKDFLHVAANYDKGRGYTEDANDFRSFNKYAKWPKWINGLNGHRSDTAHNYVYNQADNKNLVVKSGYIVKRIVFEGKRAVGVEYVPDSRFHPNEPPQVLTARATRQIVVSAGSLGSPLILERSGLGNKEILDKYNIPVVSNLPGVGQKYNDHYGVYPSYLASDESLTLDGIIMGKPEELERWVPEWTEKGTGLLAHSGQDAALKLRPTEEELKAIGPEFAEHWKAVYADSPDKAALWFGPLAMLTGYPTAEVPPKKFFSIIFFILHPASAGHIHVTSGDDVNAPPDFDTGYLTKPADLALLRWAYKRSREFARRMPCYRGEFAPWHPKFPEGSEATCKMYREPVPVDAPDIRWTAEDDRAIEKHTLEYVTTTWHSLGTCPMKPREQGGVVDSRLNVYGVEGLKVSDLSICPGNVSANTYNTAVVIAEKTAALIGEELGIKV